MESEVQVFQELLPPADSLRIPVREVARLARCGPSDRWSVVVRGAIEEARRLIQPRARWMTLPEQDIASLFPSDTPVEGIARDSEVWAFVASLGPTLEERVRAHFDDSRYLEAVLLDAAGSVAVEAVCDEVERRCADGASSERFSPGYCGWALEGQHGLFSLLRPEEIGIQLLPSLLMSPLKSVSGVVVKAAQEALRVPPEACAQCDARGCTRRRSAPG